ncbi:hypothetical protein FNF27_00969 [Cafeteria roenbergensis]|uniref:1-phosphatidylinositol-3-phosphate 5-kinase n=2 Tax=Cafeteria roenbergensis TaxID=33653 RepID=A0A5A8EKZ8_CAFRO|nr:hypothetical protein FNF27_00969 [Cafeteria roenbergensis]
MVEFGMTRMQAVLQQEDVYCGMLVRKIAALQPTLVLCSQGIARPVLEELAMQGVVAVPFVKRGVLVRVSRATGAAVVPSVNHLDKLPRAAVIGRARRFRVEPISLLPPGTSFPEAEVQVGGGLGRVAGLHPGESASAATRAVVERARAMRAATASLMRVDANPGQQGCTVILRGGPAALKSAKAALRAILPVVYTTSNGTDPEAKPSSAGLAPAGGGPRDEFRLDSVGDAPGRSAAPSPAPVAAGPAALPILSSAAAARLEAAIGLVLPFVLFSPRMEAAATASAAASGLPEDLARVAALRAAMPQRAEALMRVARTSLPELGPRLHNELGLGRRAAAAAAVSIASARRVLQQQAAAGNPVSGAVATAASAAISIALRAAEEARNPSLPQAAAFLTEASAAACAGSIVLAATAGPAAAPPMTVVPLPHFLMGDSASPDTAGWRRPLRLALRCVHAATLAPFAASRDKASEDLLFRLADSAPVVPRAVSAALSFSRPGAWLLADSRRRRRCEQQVESSAHRAGHSGRAGGDLQPASEAKAGASAASVPAPSQQRHGGAARLRSLAPPLTSQDVSEALEAVGAGLAGFERQAEAAAASAPPPWATSDIFSELSRPELGADVPGVGLDEPLEVLAMAETVTVSKSPYHRDNHGKSHPVLGCSPVWRICRAGAPGDTTLSEFLHSVAGSATIDVPVLDQDEDDDSGFPGPVALFGLADAGTAVVKRVNTLATTRTWWLGTGRIEARVVRLGRAVNVADHAPPTEPLPAVMRSPALPERLRTGASASSGGSVAASPRLLPDGGGYAASAGKAASGASSGAGKASVVPPSPMLRPGAQPRSGSNSPRGRGGAAPGAGASAGQHSRAELMRRPTLRILPMSEVSDTEVLCFGTCPKQNLRSPACLLSRGAGQLSLTRFVEMFLCNRSVAAYQPAVTGHLLPAASQVRRMFVLGAHAVEFRYVPVPVLEVATRRILPRAESWAAKERDSRLAALLSEASRVHSGQMERHERCCFALGVDQASIASSSRAHASRTADAGEGAPSTPARPGVGPAGRGSPFGAQNLPGARFTTPDEIRVTAIELAVEVATASKAARDFAVARATAITAAAEAGAALPRLWSGCDEDASCDALAASTAAWRWATRAHAAEESLARLELVVDKVFGTGVPVVGAVVNLGPPASIKQALEQSGAGKQAPAPASAAATLPLSPQLQMQLKQQQQQQQQLQQQLQSATLAGQHVARSTSRRSNSTAGPLSPTLGPARDSIPGGVTAGGADAAARLVGGGDASEPRARRQTDAPPPTKRSNPTSASATLTAATGRYPPTASRSLRGPGAGVRSSRALPAAWMAQLEQSSKSRTGTSESGEQASSDSRPGNAGPEAGRRDSGEGGDPSGSAPAADGSASEADTPSAFGGKATSASESREPRAGRSDAASGSRSFDATDAPSETGNASESSHRRSRGLASLGGTTAGGGEPGFGSAAHSDADAAHTPSTSDPGARAAPAPAGSGVTPSTTPAGHAESASAPAAGAGGAAAAAAKAAADAAASAAAKAPTPVPQSPQRDATRGKVPVVTRLFPGMELAVGGGTADFGLAPGVDGSVAPLDPSLSGSVVAHALLSASGQWRGSEELAEEEATPADLVSKSRLAAKRASEGAEAAAVQSHKESATARGSTAAKLSASASQGSGTSDKKGRSGGQPSRYELRRVSTRQTLSSLRGRLRAATSSTGGAKLSPTASGADDGAAKYPGGGHTSRSTGDGLARELSVLSSSALTDGSMQPSGSLLEEAPTAKGSGDVGADRPLGPERSGEQRGALAAASAASHTQTSDTPPPAGGCLPPLPEAAREGSEDAGAVFEPTHPLWSRGCFGRTLALTPEEILLSSVGQDVVVASEGQGRDGSVKLRVSCLWATHFHALRQLCLGSQRSFVESLAISSAWRTSGGKSGSTFERSQDHRFVVKAVSRNEFTGFTRNALAYFDHMREALCGSIVDPDMRHLDGSAAAPRLVRSRRPSFLVRILGAFEVNVSFTPPTPQGAAARFSRARGPTTKSFTRNVLVMENLWYGTTVPRGLKFDLKGKARNIQASDEAREAINRARHAESERAHAAAQAEHGPQAAGLAADRSPGVGPTAGPDAAGTGAGASPDKAEKSTVLLDSDFLMLTEGQPLALTETSMAVLMDGLRGDTEFLCDCRAMDYSLLVGVNSSAGRIVVGIIDYANTFTTTKFIEHAFKSIIESDATVQAPARYRSRMLRAVRAYFMPVPTRLAGPAIALGLRSPTPVDSLGSLWEAEHAAIDSDADAHGWRLASAPARSLAEPVLGVSQS